jgi:hypothetical protein
VLAAKCYNTKKLVKHFTRSISDLKDNHQVIITLYALDNAIDRIEHARSADELLGIEGNCAKAYFSIFGDFKTDWVFLLFPISYICSSLQSVLEKYFMDTYKESPYYVMLYEGIYGSVFTGFTAIPLSYTTCEWSTSICNKYQQYFSFKILGEDLKELRYWGFNLCLFLGGIICNVFTRLAIEAFSPCHQNVSDCLSSLLILFFEHDKFINILKLFPGEIFITIGSFIHSEIIILHICGLSENTKKEINARSASDTAISLMSMDSKTIGSRRGPRLEI